MESSTVQFSPHPCLPHGLRGHTSQDCHLAFVCATLHSSKAPFLDPLFLAPWPPGPPVTGHLRWALQVLAPAAQRTLMPPGLAALTSPPSISPSSHSTVSPPLSSPVHTPGPLAVSTLTVGRVGRQEGAGNKQRGEAFPDVLQIKKKRERDTKSGRVRR